MSNHLWLQWQMFVNRMRTGQNMKARDLPPKHEQAVRPVALAAALASDTQLQIRTAVSTPGLSIKALSSGRELDPTRAEAAGVHTSVTDSPLNMCSCISWLLLQRLQHHLS